MKLKLRGLLGLCAILAIGITTASAQKITLRGTISSHETGEPIFAAIVTTTQNPVAATLSDIDGKFALPLGVGTYNLLVKVSDKTALDTTILVERNTPPLTLKISETITQIEAVTVESRRAGERVANLQIGVENLEMNQMVRTPTLFGEKDIIKSITLLPGVKTDGEGSSGFQVRGGTASQNLILLDDAPIFSSGHVMGLFSIFNSDALYNAALYKGQIPAQFGSATSAVLDINTKYGDKQKYHFGAEIGLLSAKINAEGPIARNKAAFLITARRSYFDLFLKLSDQFRQNTMNFYDINAKIDYHPNQNNIISLSGIHGQDNMGLEDMAKMAYTNTAGTLNWFHRFSPKVSVNTSVIASAYHTANSMEINDIELFMGGHINNYILKHEYRITPTDALTLTTGVQATLIDLKSADWDMGGQNLQERRHNLQNNVWINAGWQITPRFGINAGLRLDLLSVMGGAPYYNLDADGNILDTLNYPSTHILKTYPLLEPRLSMNLLITPDQSLKLGYSRTSQHIHALRNTSMAMPFDRYGMTSNIIKPQIADQLAIGYTALLANKMFEISAEIYYKHLQNVYDYRDGKFFNSELELERLILPGIGRAYGLELLLKKNLGKITGWIGYTLGWTQTKIDGINKNQWYTASNDRRHDISIVGMYNINQNWDITASWVYNTGQALTAPSAKYEIDGQTHYYFAEKNGYRAPANHRLDISVTNTKILPKFTRTWSFGIYNAYNQLNPYMITFDENPQSATGTTTTQYSLFGILPFVSFAIKF